MNKSNNKKSKIFYINSLNKIISKNLSNKPITIPSKNIDIKFNEKIVTTFLIIHIYPFLHEVSIISQHDSTVFRESSWCFTFAANFRNCIPLHSLDYR